MQAACAGDDAAGLAISEKMRAQITGLERATNNAQDGISLVQTAEGALTEVHSMLNRMVDLATQASNGTYDNDVDRLNLEKEVVALKEEINRVASSTNFNGIKLLNGSLGGGGTTTPTVPTITGSAGVTVTPPAAATKAKFEITASSTTTDDSMIIEYTDGGGAAQTVTLSGLTITGTAETDVNALVTAINNDATLKTLFTASNDSDKLVLEAKDAGAGKQVVTKFEFGKTLSGLTGSATTVTAKSGTGTAATTEGSISGFDTDGETLTIDGTVYEFDDDNSVTGDNVAIEDFDALKTALAEKGIALTGAIDDIKFASAAGATGAGLRLQIGDTADQAVTVSIGDMSATALGLDGVSVASETGAADSIALIKAAINTVSGTRADLGAIQNRLEHTVNNLTTTTENMTNAESRIRDTDMAKEMMAFTKNNVLAQAAQSMLAQANQQPQQVLQLLR